MVSPSKAFVPLSLKGLVIHPENALKFDFLMDTGDTGYAGRGTLDMGRNEELKEEALKMMKYFLTALTMPEEDLWVNLSPYEKGRIIEDNFRKTLMGRDLLAEDYVLKQLTASLIYPEETLGKQFWQEVYRKAGKELGTTQIPVNTFNKVWIMPSEAIVWEHEGKVIIVKSTLKVMLEEDYLALSKNMIPLPSREGLGEGVIGKRVVNEAISPRPSPPHQGEGIHSVASQAVRNIVLPVLEKEVNEGQHFANLRQMYQGMILATWYKKALKESILTKIYADKKKTRGVDNANKGEVEAIYKQYLTAFKKGAFNYIKEEYDSASGHLTSALFRNIAL